MSINIGILASSRSAAPSAALLLDTYTGAAAAYSFRKLRTAYIGPCIRVQSSASGNPTMDIGFVNNVLDTATMQTFVGINTGRVKIWYDQSGNGNDATNVNTTSLPVIITTGTLITDGGKVACIAFESMILNNAIVPNNSYAGFAVMSRTNPSGYMTSFCGTGTPIISIAYSNGILYNYNNATEIQYPFSLTGRFLFTTINSSTIQNAYRNNALQTTASRVSVSSGSFTRFLARNSSEAFQGKTQEHILYNTDQSANNNNINTNINTYYTIY